MSRLDEALKRARDTRRLEIGRGALARTAEVFREQCGDPAKAVVICDRNTYDAAGLEVLKLLPEPEMRCFGEAKVAADDAAVQRAELLLRNMDAIPIAVGSGTINDIVKLASHRVGRAYMCVATAASMDGYTAYGASITKDGSKQTFECPAPRAVVADIDVLAAAPAHMNAAGYADLLAKMTAGADWIIADALAVEKIDPHAWETVQGGLRAALAHPIDIERLAEGLLMSGFAMQALQSSRPASGAEHQFSHLWDMEHATDASHGFKVGVATVAVARFYEELMTLPLQEMDVAAACAAWPTPEQVELSVYDLFYYPDVTSVARRESLAKYVTREQLGEQLRRLRDVWPDLKRRLREHLPASSELAAMLAAAGAPVEPEQIGISAKQLRLSFYKALHIRRRFTVLDLAARAGVFDQVLDRVFPESGG
jgi:glycerol-1-phosphate dehydrogenase [NAD(P)+]